MEVEHFLEITKAVNSLSKPAWDLNNIKFIVAYNQQKLIWTTFTLRKIT